jgi:hypothetical protein
VATSTPELVAAQLGERLRSGYAGERGDDGPHLGKPPRRDSPATVEAMIERTVEPAVSRRWPDRIRRSR